MKKLFCIISLLFFVSVFSQRNDYILAENYFRSSEYEKATGLYEKLLKRSPFNANYLQRLASCYQYAGRYQYVENLFKKKLRVKSNQINLYVLLGDNFEKQEKTTLSKEFYNKAIENIHKFPGYGSLVAKSFKEINKLDLAILAYKKTMQSNNGSNYDFQIAQLYGEKGDFNQMFDAYIDYLDKNKRYLSRVKRYTAPYINDDPENENNILFKKALLKRSISNPKDEWNSLLAWLFTKQTQYNKALVQLKALLARNSDNLGEIYQLGKITFKSKEYDVAKECFHLVVEKTNYPQDRFEAISKLLQIDIATKQENIEQRFESVFEKYGMNRNTFPVQMVYADFLTFNKNNPEKAMNIAEQAVHFARSKFSKAKVKIKLGEILVYQNKLNKALILFSQVQNRLKNHRIGHLARFKVAQTSYFKNDFDWAKAQLKVLKGSSSQLTANDAAELFLTISDNQIKDSVPTGITKYTKASLLAYQRKTTESILLLNDIINEFKGQAIEDEALFKQGKLYLKIDEVEKAITNFESVISFDKAGIMADDSIYELAKIYEQKEQLEKAKEYYQKIIFEHPSSIYLVDARKKYRKLRGDEVNN